MITFIKYWYLLLFLLLPIFSRAQTITTFAGSGGGIVGDGDPATAARIDNPVGLAFDKDGSLYIGEGGNRVRKIDTLGIITTIAGNGSSGYSGDGGPATDALLNFPNGVALDTSGNIYVADCFNHVIRKINKVTGIITTVCGNGTWGSSGDGGPATAAQIYGPNGICLDRRNNLYIADASGCRVRKVNPAGIISTFAGTGATGYNGDGIQASTARVDNPLDVKADDEGNIYISESGNSRIRKVDTAGIISTYAGNGIYTYIGDGMAATSAQFVPDYICFDQMHNLYISSTYWVFKIDHADHTFHTIAGNGSATDTGDGGPAIAASIYAPIGLAFDRCGNLYTAVHNYNKIRKITFPGTVDTSAISITASPTGAVCAGTSVTFTSSIVNGGATPRYQWCVNGTAITGATGSTYTYIPANGDSVYCVLTSSIYCINARTVGSNVIPMSVHSLTIPTTSIVVSPMDTICAGASVTLTATTSGGGTLPVYHWSVNGMGVATTSAYTYTPVDGDNITLAFSSSATCASPVSVTDTMHMVVHPLVTPAASIAITPADTVCAGTNVTLSAVTTGGGTLPGYQWILNDLGVCTTDSFTYIPTNGDDLELIFTSSAPCASPVSVTVVAVPIIVLPALTPSVTIAATPGTILAPGESASFSATVSGAGTGITYAWVLNSTYIPGATNATYTSAEFSDHDSLSCIISTGNVCGDIIASNSVIISLQNLGVKTNKQASELTVFPNPNNGSFTVKGEMGVKGDRYTITVKNIIGQVVYTKTTTALTTTINEQITMGEQLAKGMYMLEVTNESGVKSITKIIKE